MPQPDYSFPAWSLRPGHFVSGRCARLVLEACGCLVCPPAGGPDFEAFPLPVLPSADFDCMVRLLRLAWRIRFAPATWLLYLDVPSRSWRYRLPAQSCLQEPLLMDLARSMESQHSLVVSEPPDSWLAAGAFAAHPARDHQLLKHAAAGTSGLWLFWHPGSWAEATAMLHAGGQSLLLPLDRVLVDLDPRGQTYLTDSPSIYIGL